MELKKYLDQAVKAYQKGYTVMETEVKRHNAAMDAIKENSGELSSQALNKRADEENHAFNAAIDKADNDMMNAVDAVRESCNQEITAFYALDGHKIDDADTKILNSGIVLSASEIETMFRKHGDNATMIRVIADYAAVHRIDDISEEATVAFFKAKAAGEREKKAVATFLHLCHAAVNMVRDGSTFSKAYYTAVDNIAEYALDAERTILKSAMFLTEKERSRLQEIDNYFADKTNASRAKAINI